MLHDFEVWSYHYANSVITGWYHSLQTCRSNNLGWYQWRQCWQHDNPRLWCDDTDIDKHWLRLWLAAWRHQAITWSNTDLSSKVFCSILVNWEIMLLELLPHPPGASELNFRIDSFGCIVIRRQLIIRYILLIRIRNGIIHVDWSHREAAMCVKFGLSWKTRRCRFICFVL